MRFPTNVLSFAASLALLSVAVGAAPPALRTMPTSEIRAGMRGYGLSVFQGHKPERFDVEVIGVLHNFRPDQDLVLIRTPHPLLDHTGSVAGMSGSPVYLDDRLIGAYAYGWSFGKDPIAGVTPIANMLKELGRPMRPGAFPVAEPLATVNARPRRERTGYLGGERRDAFWGLSRFAQRRVEKSTHPELVPCATPLLVGGVTPQVASLLKERFAPLGLEVIEAASGASAAQGDEPSEYVDGGSIAVTLLRGDIQATAVGTVTHVDGRRAIGFGHPMLDAGEVGLPTATSRVLHVLASERTSFKIAEAVRPLGALIHDRQSAIVVDTDVAPATIPVSVRIRGLPGLPRELWRVEAVNHRLLTPALVLTALGSALGATLNDSDDMMFRAESVVHVAGHGPQRVVDEGYVATGIAQLGSLARLRLFDLLEAAYDNPFSRAHIERVEVNLDLRFGREITELVSARLTSDEVDPGQPARVVLTLRPFDGSVIQRVVEVPIPAALAGEQIELEVLPGDHVRPELPVPQNLRDVLANVRAGYPSTSLVIQLQRRARGLSLAGNVVRDLPGSMLDTLSTVSDTARTPSFVTQHRMALPMGQSVVGQAKLSLSVREEKR